MTCDAQNALLFVVGIVAGWLVGFAASEWAHILDDLSKGGNP